MGKKRTLEAPPSPFLQGVQGGCQGVQSGGLGYHLQPCSHYDADSEGVHLGYPLGVVEGFIPRGAGVKDEVGFEVGDLVFHMWCNGYRLVLTIRRRGCQGRSGQGFRQPAHCSRWHSTGRQSAWHHHPTDR